MGKTKFLAPTIPGFLIIPYHYQDNRAAYVFAHPRDLVDAGVIGVLFGAGAGQMTGPSTDGGFVAAQGDIVYAAPSPPDGLAAGNASGILVHLRWNENSEPDLWGYRILYHLHLGGTQVGINVSRQNTYSLILPQSGSWEIRLVAIDAMGQESAPSAPVTVTILSDAKNIYLPEILN